jgi:hypothetical protein
MIVMERDDHRETKRQLRSWIRSIADLRLPETDVESMFNVQ